MAIAADRGLGRPPVRDGPLSEASLLLQWRPSELRVARKLFLSCSPAELEDIYDETCDVLRKRAPHQSELHLRGALRSGIRMRALNVIRDRKRHERIIGEAAPGVYADARHDAQRMEPERVLLAQEDGFVIGEFISELTEPERQVFALVAEGQSWRAIATSLGIPETESRSLTRSCERKRERFTTVYATGRLCGYRSHTIDGLLSGAYDGEMALRQALAHLRHCRDCQRQHQVTGAELRVRFDGDALALLPAPLSLSHMSVLDKLHAAVLKALRLLDRAMPGNGGIREHATESLAGGAVAAKTAIAVGVIAVTGAVIAVHHAIDPSPPRHDSRAASVPAATTTRPFVSELTGGPAPVLDSAGPLSQSHDRRSAAPRRGPGHLIGTGNASPGHLIEHTEGPGHLISTSQSGAGNRTSESGEQPPIKPIGSNDASTASAQPSPGSTLTAPSKATGPGRLLGP